MGTTEGVQDHIDNQGLLSWCTINLQVGASLARAAFHSVARLLPAVIGYALYALYARLEYIRQIDRKHT